MKVVVHQGPPPTIVENPNVKALLEHFRMQNEMLDKALTTVVLIQEGTSIRSAVELDDKQ